MDPASPKGVMTYTPSPLAGDNSLKPVLERQRGLLGQVGPVSVGSPQDAKSSRSQVATDPPARGVSDSKSVLDRSVAHLSRAELTARYYKFLTLGEKLFKIIETQKASVALDTVTAFIDRRIDAQGQDAIDIPASLARALTDARNKGTDALRGMKGKNIDAQMVDSDKAALKKAIQDVLDHVEKVFRPADLQDVLDSAELRPELAKLCEKLFQSENFNFLDTMRQVRTPTTPLSARMENYKAMYPRFISAKGEESINIESGQRKAITQGLEKLRKMTEGGDTEAAVSDAMKEVDDAMSAAFDEITKMLKQQDLTREFLRKLPRTLDR